MLSKYKNAIQLYKKYLFRFTNLKNYNFLTKKRPVTQRGMFTKNNFACKLI